MYKHFLLGVTSKSLSATELLPTTLGCSLQLVITTTTTDKNNIPTCTTSGQYLQTNSLTKLNGFFKIFGIPCFMGKT